TNPAAGDYTTAMATRNAAGGTIDSGTTPAVVLVASTTEKSIVVEQSLTYSLETKPPTIVRDASAPAVAYESYTTIITVLTNASSGYRLTVSSNATRAP